MLIESVIQEDQNWPWSAVYIQPVELNTLVLQVSAVGETLLDILHLDCLCEVVPGQAQSGDLVDDTASPWPITRRVAQRVREGAVETQLMVTGDHYLVFVRESTWRGNIQWLINSFTAWELLADYMEYKAFIVTIMPLKRWRNTRKFNLRFIGLKTHCR